MLPGLFPYIRTQEDEMVAEFFLEGWDFSGYNCVNPSDLITYLPANFEQVIRLQE
jgi:hypothetical protein